MNISEPPNEPEHTNTNGRDTSNHNFMQCIVLNICNKNISHRTHQQQQKPFLFFFSFKNSNTNQSGNTKITTTTKT